jgi:hypothetical protein
MLNGTFIFGEFKGIKKTLNYDDPTKSTYYVGLKVATKTTDWGSDQDIVLSIQINAEDLPRLATCTDDFAGKQVFFRVGYASRKGGRSGAWCQAYLPKGEVFGFADRFANLDNESLDQAVDLF